ncbi:MAG TPA: hypothetical protein VLF79_00555 [Candidatus Saccharimonadales bacterium]|nr:hypothetical protein [Candidatus Saccharimonadales bacterium]
MVKVFGLRIFGSEETSKDIFENNDAQQLGSRIIHKQVEVESSHTDPDSQADAFNSSSHWDTHKPHSSNEQSSGSAIKRFYRGDSHLKLIPHVRDALRKRPHRK